jgi:hypothetical protein
MSFEPVTAVLDVVGKVIERIWPDPEQRAKAQLELFKLQQAGELQEIAGQLEINKIEAANTSTFVSGWRPGVGWVCVTALAINYIVSPLATWASALFGHPTAFPILNGESLMALLTGILGLGTLRTIDKNNGVAAK